MTLHLFFNTRTRLSECSGRHNPSVASLLHTCPSLPPQSPCLQRLVVLPLPGGTHGGLGDEELAVISAMGALQELEFRAHRCAHVVPGRPATQPAVKLRAAPCAPGQEVATGFKG